MSPSHVRTGAPPVHQSTERAGAWFVESGIQERNGGVARYFRSDLGQNARVSTEITGYAVSALVFLHNRDPHEEYRGAALRAGEFLVRKAWDRRLSVFPFEHSDNGNAPEALTYFFDTGIIARGLIALWRATQEREFLDAAILAGESLKRDFACGGCFHPILRLPSKEPLPHTPQWSGGPGCYQLKSALAWHDLFVATGDERFRAWFDSALGSAIDTHASFLPAETPEKTMDRLHAYSYFLEALLAARANPEVRDVLHEGICRVSHYLREISPTFERSDVYAQLLRVRVLADDFEAVPLNRVEAEFEAERIPEFQLSCSNKRVDGGFAFGVKGKHFLPYVNPVSTAFCLQAVEMWRDYCAGIALDYSSLI